MAKVINTSVGGGIVVKNIQKLQGIIAPTVATTINITIPTAVDLTIAVVRISHILDLGSGNVSDQFLSAKLSSPTNVQLDRIGIASATWDYDIEVIEFEGIKGIQTGSFPLLLSGLDNETIPSINRDKSMLFYSFRTDGTGTTSSIARGEALAKITSDTNIQFTQLVTSYNTTFEWFILELE
jgi:hypothetical protein